MPAKNTSVNWRVGTVGWTVTYMSMHRPEALSQNEKQTLVSLFEDGTTVIKLPENIVLNSGFAPLGEPGRETLQLLATALESFAEHLISIQGHGESRRIEVLFARGSSDRGWAHHGNRLLGAGHIRQNTQHSRRALRPPQQSAC